MQQIFHRSFLVAVLLVVSFTVDAPIGALAHPVSYSSDADDLTRRADATLIERSPSPSPLGSIGGIVSGATTGNFAGMANSIANTAAEGHALHGGGYKRDTSGQDNHHVTRRINAADYDDASFIERSPSPSPLGSIGGIVSGATTGDFAGMANSIADTAAEGHAMDAGYYKRDASELSQ